MTINGFCIQIIKQVKSQEILLAFDSLATKIHYFNYSLLKHDLNYFARYHLAQHYLIIKSSLIARYISGTDSQIPSTCRYTIYFLRYEPSSHWLCVRWHATSNYINFDNLVEVPSKQMKEQLKVLCKILALNCVSLSRSRSQLPCSNMSQYVIHLCRNLSLSPLNPVFKFALISWFDSHK